MTNAGVATNPENVKVVVRVRPPNNREGQIGIITETIDPDTIVINGKLKPRSSSTFDRVFGMDSRQQQVYDDVAHDSVAAVLDGFNSTIIAYGQTGTGKTYTMTGGAGHDVHAPTSVPAEHVTDTMEGSAGVIPRAARHVFDWVTDHEGELEVNVYCSYCEIYKERINDLLYLREADPESGLVSSLPDVDRDILSFLPRQKAADPRRQAPELETLEIREDKERGIYVQSLTEALCGGVGDVLTLIAQGVKNRAVRATDFNEHSSRSHSIFQMVVESRPIDGREPVVTRSKLNLVDLAGSEKWRTHTDMAPARVAELTAINQSLSTLGNCICALTQAGRSHIPFRDSKLTRLLADSLGGNAKTVFIVTVSPSSLNEEETLSTVMFADRAKRVVTHVRRNEMVDQATLIKRYEAEVTRLRAALAQNGATGDAEGLAAADEENLRLREEAARLGRQVYRLREENAALGAAGPPADDPTGIRNGFLEARVRELETERYDLLARLADADALRKWIDTLRVDRGHRTVSGEQKVGLLERSLGAQARELHNTKKLFCREVSALQDELAKKTQRLLTVEADLARARRPGTGHVPAAGEAVLPTARVEQLSRSTRAMLVQAVSRYNTPDGSLDQLREDVCNQAAASLYGLYAELESSAKQMLMGHPVAPAAPSPRSSPARSTVSNTKWPAPTQPEPSRPPQPLSPRVAPGRESVTQSLDRFFAGEGLSPDLDARPGPVGSGRGVLAAMRREAVSVGIGPGPGPESALQRLQHLNSLLATATPDPAQAPAKKEPQPPAPSQSMMKEDGRRILPPPPSRARDGAGGQWEKARPDRDDLKKMVDKIGLEKLTAFTRMLERRTK